MRLIIIILVFISCYSGVAQTMHESDNLHEIKDYLMNGEKIVSSHKLWNQDDTVLIDTAFVSLQEWLISKGLTDEIVVNSNLEELYQDVLRDYRENNDILVDIDLRILCDSLRANYGSQHLCYAIAQEISAILKMCNILYNEKLDQILSSLIDAHRIYSIHGKIIQQRRVERLMYRSLCVNSSSLVVNGPIILQADSLLRLSFGYESREYLLCLNKMAKITNEESEELSHVSQSLYNRLFNTYNSLGLPKDSLFVSSAVESLDNWWSPYINENVVRAVKELYDINWLPDSVFGYVIGRYKYCPDSICQMQRLYIYTQGKRLMESREHTADSLFFLYVKQLVDEYWHICLKSRLSYDFRRLLDVSNNFFEEFSLSDESFLNKLGLSEKLMDMVCFRIIALNELGNRDKAAQLAKDYLKITKDFYGVLSENYYKRIKNVWLYSKGFFEDISLLSEKYEVERFFLGEKSEIFQQTLRDLAEYYASEKNYSDAIQLMENVNYKDAGTLYDLSKYYEAYGDKKKAVESYYQLYDATREMKTPNDSMFLDAAAFYIGIYAVNSGRKTKVIRDYIKAFDPKDFNTFALCANIFIFELSATEWNKLSARWYKRHRKKLTDAEKAGFALLQLDISSKYSLLGEKRPSQLQVADNLLAVYNSDDLLSSIVRLYLCTCKEQYYWNTDFGLALNMNDEEQKLLMAFQNYERLYEYRQFLARRTYCLYKLGRYQEASETATQYIQHVNDEGQTLPYYDIFEQIFVSTPLTIEECLPFILAQAGKTDLAEKRFSEIGQRYIDCIKTNDIANFSPDEVNLQTIVYGATAIPSDTLSSLAYDASMLSKAYAITADKSIERIVQTSTDSALINKFQEMQLTVIRLDANKDSLVADSLRERISLLRTQIYYDTSKSENVNEPFNVSWRQISQSLKDGQVAIEFMRYRTNADPYVKDTIRYCAAVINGRSKHPQMVDLCSSSQLMDIETPYKGHAVYDLIWKPMAHYLKDANEVFFAPDGQLHQIAIESVSDEDGRAWAERYRLHRLTSTRNVVEQKHLSSDNAVLFGGLTYNFSEDDWSAIANNAIPQEEFPDESMRSVYDHYRGAVNYLSGTLEEVEKIDHLLFEQHIHSTLYTDKDGTESQFKQLSDGKVFRLLHLATHGFYVPNDTIHLNRARFIDRKTLRTSNYNSEDNSMSRAGLFLAGSANAMSKQGRNHFPVQADDGILTAKEISRLRLPADLVVLSACETALGDITGDGVFGLQRGFKKAGAQSLLMSLWKVDDEATCLLMTEFYNNWIGEGRTKHDALEQAKQTVYSHKEKGWDDPKYWAAFILLDGLD